MKAVLEQLQKGEDLSVCSGATTREFQLSVLLVKSCCGCGTGTVREPRKGNIRRWNPVPED
jgi:hypothetical protein